MYDDSYPVATSSINHKLSIFQYRLRHQRRLGYKHHREHDWKLFQGTKSKKEKLPRDPAKDERVQRPTTDYYLTGNAGGAYREGLTSAGAIRQQAKEVRMHD